MKNLFLMGGPSFMSVLTLLFVLMIAWFVYHLIIVYNSQETNKEKLLRKLEYGKSIGLFALITGIMGQLVGFRAMFFAIGEAAGRGEKIIPALVYEGISVTMIVTIYGIIIYLISILLWFLSSAYMERK